MNKAHEPSPSCSPCSQSTPPVAGNKKFFIQTFGCAMNVYDGTRISNMLVHHGWVHIDNIEDADLIILNTCSIREKATNKVFSALGRIRLKKKPDALFGIIGCVAREAGADAFRRIPELNFVLGPQSYHKLIDVLENPDTRLLNIDLGGLEKFDELPQMISSDRVAYIPIQEGCNHVCTYCIVPYTRGREISRPFDDIMVDVEHAANTGAIEICFLGQNVNGYRAVREKSDTDSDTVATPVSESVSLSDLILATATIPAIKRIQFMSSYPSEMTDDLIDLFRTEPKLLPILHLPMQSGSANVLARMNRPYDLNMYIDTIAKLRAANPEIQISSDFIVGFPGESDADFEQTMDIIRQIGFINSYSYKYSMRPHTGAALMKDQITDPIKRTRLKAVDDLLNENTRAFNESCVGKVMPCLYIGPDKTGDNLVFRTPFMQQCIVAAPQRTDNREQITDIRITAANKSSLRGEIV